MASAEAVGADAKPVASKAMPKVTAEKTADEEKFECPQAWFLALVTVAMSFMTSITVVGSLFFLLAAPEKVSPHCYAHERLIVRVFCTGSTMAFWTYPVVCCLFVVLLYAKNLVDQRTYYEFLLHRVVVGYGRNPAWKQPVVLALLVYAITAFSALVWYHYSQADFVISHVYCSLAYITPIISFLAVIFTQWSIQGKLITLPNFLADYKWAVQHLNDSRSYSVEAIHGGYNCMEHDLDQSEEVFDTPKMIALVEHYAAKVQAIHDADGVEEDAEATAPKDPKLRTPEEQADRYLLEKVSSTPSWVYWQVRMLFSPRLQDERSQSFRNWALAYMVSVVFAVLLSVYIFACCLVTCLEIEKVLTPSTPAWAFTHFFSLRPDIDHGDAKSFKQLAASVAMSAMQTGARSFYSRSVTPSHFTLGAAA